ncbi:hypothetical protein EDD80_102147 [Anseongella ginsenosidimutans]|uniref:Uncharacterized protein n=1 Tax=Anseongella ginsenosidimutans TaxID=496056 RepID=A0A4R3KW59_9SPHI|nr:hypothetical protein EDD80_102147 [Anseongella ginsenosidimutans]
MDDRLPPNPPAPALSSALYGKDRFSGIGKISITQNLSGVLKR